MSSPYKINITAGLNEQETIKNINAQISILTKNLKSLNINVDISGSQFAQIKKQITDLQKQLSNSGAEVKSPDTSKAKKSITAYASQVKATMANIKKELSTDSNQVTVSADYDKETQQLKGLIATVYDLQGNINKIKYGINTAELRADGKSFDLDPVANKFTDNTEKMTRAINTAKANIISNLNTIRQSGLLTSESFKNYLDKINTAKSTTELNKIKQEIVAIKDESKNNITEDQINKQTAAIKQQVVEWQRLKTVQLNNLSNRFDNFSKLDSSYPESYQKLQQAIQDINKAPLDQVKSKMKDADLSIKEFGSQAEIAGGRVMTFGDHMKQSIASMAMWSVGGGIFFGAISSMKQLVNTIIDVDTQITQLKRVMSSGTNFDSMLSQMLHLSTELGRSFDDVAANAQEFAKQGFDQSQVISLTKVATLLQNISDLTPQESMDALMSGIQNFGVKAKDSIKIANSLNETDNQFSISTQQLAQSMAKAGSTAKAYHVSLSSVIGATTAVGSATRESGSVIGNFLKTLYARLETMPKSVAALKSVGISVKDSAGQMKSASSVLGELHDRWGSLSDAQKQYLGLSLGGAQQLNRVFALLNNYNLALKAQETSEKSAGSAQRENQRYMDSYAAKIQQLKTQWTQLQVQMGKSFVNSGMSDGISVLMQLAKASTSLVEHIGALPSAFALANIAAVTLSKTYRSQFATATDAINLKLDRAKATAKGNTEEVARLDTQAKKLSKTSASASFVLGGMSGGLKSISISARAAAISFGLFAAETAGIMVIGAAISWLVNKYSDYQQQQANVEKSIKNETSSYRAHSKEIEKLKNDYADLSKQASSGTLSSTDAQKYEDVQNRLNKLLPSVTDHIDKENNAHLKSSKVVSEAVDQYKKLSKAKTDAIIADLPNNLNKANKELDKAKNKLSDLQKESQLKIANVDNPNAWVPKTPDSNVENLNKQTIATREVQVAQDKLKNTMKEFASAYAESEDGANKLTDADKSYISSLVDQNEKELKTKKGQENLQKQIRETTGSFIKFRDELGKDLPTKSISDLVKSIQGINVDKISGNRTLTAAKKDVYELSEAYKNGEITGKQFVAALEKDGVSSKNASKAQKQMAKDIANASDKAKGQSKVLVDLVNDLGDASKVGADLTKALSFGIPDATESKQAINVYQIMSKLADEAGGKTHLNATQQQLLNQAYQTLADNFPQFVNGHKLNIKAIQAEIKNNNVLTQAIEAAANGTLTAEQASLLAKAQATQKRIKLIQAEIDAMDAYAQAYKEFIARTEDSYNDMDGQNQLIANKVATRLKQQKGGSDAAKKVKALRNEVSSLSKVETSTIGKLDTSMNKSTKSTKKSTESITKYKYVADKLAASLDSVNSKIQIMSDMTSRYDQASSKYRSNISKEISLLKEKNDILKAQAKSLTAQIKAGNIIQYGELSSTSTKTTYTSSGSSSGSSKSVSGGSNVKSWTSAIKSAAAEMGVKLTKAGLNAILSQIRTESGGSETVFNNWDSNAKAGHPSRGLLQYIPSTFNKYKVKGHGNILNGYDQLLAFFNNSNWYSDIAGSGGWGPSGYKRTSSAKAISGSSKGSGSSSSSTSKTIGKTKADKQAAVAQAKQQLNDLKEQIVANENAIQQAYLDLVNSHITAYDNRLKSYDASISKYASKAESANVASKSYRSDVTKEISISKSKQKEQVKEINYIEKQIKTNKHLTSAQKADLKSQLSDKKADLESTKAAIKQFYADIVNSNITHMENISNTIDVSIAKYQQMASVAKQGSSDQIRALNAEEAATNKKLVNQEKELAYIDKQWQSNKNLTAAQKRELRTQSEQLKSTIASTVEALQQLNLDIVNGQVAGYESKAKAIDAVLARYQYEASAVDQTSKAYVDAINREIDATKQKQAIQQQELDFINQQIASNDKLTSAQKQQLQEQANDLQSTIYQSMSSIKDFADSIKQVYQTVADSVVDTMKDAYQKQIDAAQKAHDKKVDMLDDEQKKFDDNIQKQTDAIDKQASDNSYAEELASDQKAVTDLQTQLANFAMDNSIQGKAKTADLKSQFADAQKTLDSFQKDHAVDVRKQALEDQQTAFDANIDTQKQSADDQMTAYEDQINGILDNDRKWTGIQQDILNGHYGDVLKDFQNFSGVFQQESSLLGQSITDNLLDKIKDLSSQIQGLGLSGNGTNTAGYSTSGVQLPAFADGGFTGSNVPSSGMMALLHKNEWVFNTDQQKNLMGWVGGLAQTAMNAVTSMASQFVTPNISTVNNTSTTSTSTPIAFTNCSFGTSKQDTQDALTQALNDYKSRGGRI